LIVPDYRTGMIIYNVTVKVDHSIAAGWLAWLKEEHIPAVISTGCFTHAIILHLWESDDPEGITYAVQFHTGSKALYEQYSSRFAEAMRKKEMDKWGHQFISFHTAMQVVN
jgi:hypothetical protein